MARFAVVLAVVLTVVSGSCALAQGNDAAAYYMEGDRLWSAGDIDGAITQWSQALKLKPSSSLTKDRLIEALQKKVVLLTQQLERTKEVSTPAATLAPAAPAAPVLAAVPQTTGDFVLTPEIVAGTDKAYNKMISDATSGMTNVQLTAWRKQWKGWKGEQGCRVQWVGTIASIDGPFRAQPGTRLKAAVPAGYSVDVQCGPCRVNLPRMNLTQKQALALNKGTTVTIRGNLYYKRTEASDLSPDVLRALSAQGTPFEPTTSYSLSAAEMIFR